MSQRDPNRTIVSLGFKLLPGALHFKGLNPSTSLKKEIWSNNLRSRRVRKVQKIQGDGVLKSIVTGMARLQKQSRTLPGVSLASSNYFVDSPWVVVGEAFVCQTACLDGIEYLELSCDGTSEMQNLLLQLRWRTKSNCSYHKHRRPCSWEGELRVVNYTFWIDKHFVNNRLLSSQVHVKPWSAALIFDEPK